MKHAFASLLIATAMGAVSPAMAAPTAYALDPGHTQVFASWNHLGFSNPSAYFPVKDGKLIYDPSNPARSSVKVTLDTANMETFVPKLNEHLAGKDFFQVAQFPTATFTSTSIIPDRSGTRMTIHGNLTIRGISKPVKLTAHLNERGIHPMAKKSAIGFSASGTILRSEFGMGGFTPAVSDQVTLRITAEAVAE